MGVEEGSIHWGADWQEEQGFGGGGGSVSIRRLAHACLIGVPCLLCPLPPRHIAGILGGRTHARMYVTHHPERAGECWGVGGQESLAQAAIVCAYVCVCLV